METKKRGHFSLNLKALQAQVNTLLENAGGEQAVALLDSLCELSKPEQKLALSVFTRLIDRIAQGELRIPDSEPVLKEFEESLYEDLLESIETFKQDGSTLRLEVLSGGKDQLPKSVVRIEDLRRARKLGRPTLN